MLAGAAATRIGDETRVALVFADELSVAVFSLASGEGAEWLPVGEARLPQVAFAAASLSAEELLITAQDGSVFAWGLNDVAPSMAVAAAGTENGNLAWQAACRHTHGIARLALRRAEQKAPTQWQPEVFVSQSSVHRLSATM